MPLFLPGDATPDDVAEGKTFSAGPYYNAVGTKAAGGGTLTAFSSNPGNVAPSFTSSTSIQFTHSMTLPTAPTFFSSVSVWNGGNSTNKISWNQVAGGMLYVGCTYRYYPTASGGIGYKLVNNSSGMVMATTNNLNYVGCRIISLTVSGTTLTIVWEYFTSNTNTTLSITGANVPIYASIVYS